MSKACLLGLCLLAGLPAGALAQAVQNVAPPSGSSTPSAPAPSWTPPALSSPSRAAPMPAAPSPTAPRAIAPAPGLSFHRVNDPTEGAFTVEVPSGWRVEGGTTRLSAVDVRHSIRVWSPDQQIYAFRGDSSLGMFIVPSQLTDMANLREGSVYQGPAGSMVIQRYLPGIDFVRTWLGGAQRQCSGLRIVNQESFDQASRQLMADLNRVFGGTAQYRIDAGAVDFACGASGNVGSVTATTMLTQIVGAAAPPFWVVLDLGGFIAPVARVQEAAAVAARLQSSFRYDPAWAARQEQTTRQVSGILQSTHDSISRTILQTHQQRSRTLDGVFARGAEARRGTVTIDDPALGRRTITNSHRYYWTNPQGQIVGTDTDTAPGPNYRGLRIVTP